jgi:F-type H+-transporting ATPase subunit c
MSKKGFVGALTAMLVLGAVSTAFAGSAAENGVGLWKIYFGIAIACGFGIGIAALGTGRAMGNALSSALEGTARNPEASGKIMTSMIIGMALIEALCIYALVICLIMAFRIPSFEAITEKLFM